MARTGDNIYKRKDGRWEGRYIKNRATNGKISYGYIYGRSYMEVKNKLGLFKPYKVTEHSKKLLDYNEALATWADYWLECLVKPTVKTSTYASYKSKMSTHILKELGEIKIKELTQEHVEQLLIGLQGSLQLSSVKTVFAVLKTCLQEAVDMAILPVNPCDQALFQQIFLPETKQ